MKIPVFEQAMVRSVLTFSGSSLSNSLGYALSLKIYIPSAEQIITREQLHSQKTTTFNIQAANQHLYQKFISVTTSAASIGGDLAPGGTKR